MENNKIKVNLLGDDAPSYRDLMSKYQDEIISGEISQEVLDGIVSAFIWHKEDVISQISFSIESIIYAIMSIKYFPGIKDEGQIYSLMRHISFLENYWEINSDEAKEFYNMKELCESLYGYTRKYSLLKDYVPEEPDEDFKYEHLLDANYHLNNFKEYGKDDEYFMETLRRFI